MKKNKENNFNLIENEHFEGNEQELNEIEQNTHATIGFAKAPFSIVDKFFTSFFGLIISMFGGKS